MSRGFNEYEKAIDRLDLGPLRREWCCICGKRKDHGHHAVFRSHGGRDKHIVSLCSECHRDIHDRKVYLIAHDGVLMAAIDLHAKAVGYENGWGVA